LLSDIHSPAPPESAIVTDTLFVFEFSLLESTLAPESASAPAVLLRLSVEPSAAVVVRVEVGGVADDEAAASGLEVVLASLSGSCVLAGSSALL